MKTLPRRGKLKIYGELLSALRSGSNADKIVLTQVQVKIKVPFDRFKTYIIDLVLLA